MEYLPWLSVDKYVANRVGLQPDADLQRGRRGGGASIITRSQAMDKLRSKALSLLAARNSTFFTIGSYTDFYNSWRNGLPEIDEKSTQHTFGDDHGRRMWAVTRTVRIATTNGFIILRASKESVVLKLAMEKVCEEILREVLLPDAQMDNAPSKESVQGDATQMSVKDSNTIITRDQSVTISCPIPMTTVTDLASSEPPMMFQSLVGRWVPMKSIVVKTTHKLDEMLASYYLPESLLTKEMANAPNTIPFETFAYGNYDYALKFVTNANKFQCGKVIVSCKFDSYQADLVQNGYQSHLSRPHIILDLSANNEGVLEIHFRHRRAFVRNVAHATANAAVRPGKFATVYVSILSPLRTGSDGANDMNIRPFYIIRRAEFTGMSYKVPIVQMESIRLLEQAYLPTLFGLWLKA